MKHSQLLDLIGIALLAKHFNNIMFTEVLFQHCKSHYLEDYTKWKSLEIQRIDISIKYKHTIIYQLLLINENVDILLKQFKDIFDTYQANYSSSTWYCAEDVYLTKTLMETKYLPIKMGNKSIYSICKRYEDLKHIYGDDLQVMLTRCQTNMDKEEIVEAKKGSKWAKQEETVLTDHLIKNPEISGEKLKEFLPGRTLSAINQKKLSLKRLLKSKTSSPVQKSNPDPVYRNDTNFTVSRILNKKPKRCSKKWNNEEREELRKAYAEDRNCIKLQNMGIFKNRSVASLQNMLDSMSNVETKDIANTNWSNKDCKLLMDMYAKGETLDEMVQTFKGRTYKGIQRKIAKEKKKLEKQTSLDAVNPKLKQKFLNANEQYNCNFICSYIQDPDIDNNVEFCENRIKLMKATQHLDLRKILICFDKSEIRVCFGAHGDKQDIIEKKKHIKYSIF